MTEMQLGIYVPTDGVQLDGDHLHGIYFCSIEIYFR